MRKAWMAFNFGRSVSLPSFWALVRPAPCWWQATVCTTSARCRPGLSDGERFDVQPCDTPCTLCDAKCVCVAFVALICSMFVIPCCLALPHMAVTSENVYQRLFLQIRSSSDCLRLLATQDIVLKGCNKCNQHYISSCLYSVFFFFYYIIKLVHYKLFY